jgi:hypothetical protein
MYSSTLPLTSALDECTWSAPRTSCFALGRENLSVVREAGWVLGLVLTDAENLTSSGIQSPDRIPRSQSL